MFRIMLRKLKPMVLSLVLILSGSFLYNNCSKGGFTVAGSGDLNMASSEPSAVSVIFSKVPLNMVNANSVSFSYEISGNNLSGVSAKCYLDQTLQADCSSPIDLSAMPDGDYTLTVDATNQNSLVLATAKRSFRLDRKGPVLTINSAPSGTINTTSASISFSVVDNFPGAAASCSLDNAAFAACTSPYNITNLAQGAHSVRLYAQDSAGNKSATQTVSFSVNTSVSVPTVAISQMPSAFSNSASASFSFAGSSSGSTIASYQCSIDNSAFAACSSPQAYSSLAEGSHSFSVKAIDATGQASSPASYSFAVDVIAPSAPAVSSNQMNPTKSTSLNLSFNSSDASGIAKYECKLDAGAYAACVSPQAFSGLSSASHTFAVRATDKAGNVSADGSYMIVIDAVPPVVTITSQPASSTQSTSASFSFSVTDALSGVNLMECQLDNQMYVNCSSPQSYSNLSAGMHSFNIRGSDKAGNSTVQGYSWSIASAATPTPTPSPSATPDPADACPLLTAEQQAYPGAVVKSVMSYGAKGDGVSDEYDAFQKMSADVSGKQFAQRQIIYFPKGTYYINRYGISGGTNANNNQRVRLVNASNFSLIGCTGSVVSFKGDFAITNDYNPGGSWSSYEFQLGFEFRNDSNFKISGLEIYGNVDKTTRPASPNGNPLDETPSHGIQTTACTNYELSHLKVHHFACDGLFIGGGVPADQNGTINDVDSYNNARQGMSMMQARTFKITNSSFRNTGITDGTYPTHSPGAGVDIEPDYNPIDGNPTRTGDMVFDGCHFLNNKGSQWVGGDNGVNTENVTIRNSEIISRPANNHPYVIIMSMPGGVIENNIINTYDGMVVPTYSEGVGNMAVVNTLVRGNTITSSGVGLQILDAGAKAVIDNNTFISAHKPGSDGPYPNIVNGAASFTNNKMSYPSANFGGLSVPGVIQVPTFTGNTISTDLTSGYYTIRVSPGTSATNNTITGHILLSQ